VLEQNLKGVTDTLRETDFPQDVVIEPVAGCNLRCIMCPQPNLKRPRGFMAWDLYAKIVNEIAAEPTPTRLWPSLMGEITLLGHDAVRMVTYATRFQVPVHLNTNGVLFDGWIAEGLMGAKPKTIIFGIDAATPETYSRIRVGGDYSRVVSNVKYAIQHRLPGTEVVVQFIEMPENAAEIEQFKWYWLDQGAVVKLRPRLGWGNRLETPFLRVAESDRIPCGWLMRSCTIRWDGKMSQCDSDCEGEYCPGDINTQTIKSVWNGELAQRRAYHWKGDFSHYCCATCKDWQAGRSHYFRPGGQRD
jgi:MoaA/NifB/PqqE/SkfB family radical SAM enzyme